ncbi:MAG: exosortase C-terminal domain/associated protein EpsI [Pseudomonadota bacterium]
MSAHAVRTLWVAALFAMTGVAAGVLKPAAAPPHAAPDLEAMMPEAFGEWRRIDLSDAVLPEETELKPGEAIAYRAYEDELGRIVTLVAAYGPPFGDSVRLHRPETCYVAQGFAVRSRSEREVDAAGRRAIVINLDTESPSRREAVTYWLRDGRGFTTKSSDSGLMRLKRGASAPADGALVRVSSINSQEPQFDLHRRFLTEFAAALGEDAQRTLLGDGPRS